MRRMSTAIAVTAIIFYGCSTALIIDDYDPAIQDAHVLQEMLPALAASISLANPQVVTPKNVFPGTPEGLPATPAAMYTDPAYYDAKSGVARYPSSGYVSDLYGEQGSAAYIELRRSTDGWGDYQVTVYVYPTLSAAVHYTVEQYRVAANAWWNLLDSSNQYDPIAFEALETHYFDNRIERRTLVSTRWSNGMVYESTGLNPPADFDDSYYDYSGTAVTGSATRTASDSGSLQEYAAEVHSIIGPATGWMSTTMGIEFYTQLIEGSEFARYSKSYLIDTFKFSNRDTTTKTVRGYWIDTTGNKTVRAKTTGRFSQGNRSWVSTTTEEILIEAADGIAASYSSTVKDYEDDVLQKTVTVTLDETAIDSNSYAGTMTVTELDGKTRTRNVTMDSDRGLDIYDESSKALSSILTYSAANVDHFGTSERMVVMSLQNGTFEGELTGGILAGKYTWNTGEVSAIHASSAFVAVDGYID